MSVRLKFEEGLCRCCHAQGMFQNLSALIICQGQAEIYSEMLQDCLNISLKPIEGEYTSTTYTICDACILRLRDANDFKNQVKECEERFKEMYPLVLKEQISIEVKEEIPDTEDIKQEQQSSDEDMDVRDDNVYKSEDAEKKELDVKVESGSGKRKGKGNLFIKGQPPPKKKRKNRVGMPKKNAKRKAQADQTQDAEPEPNTTRKDDDESPADGGSGDQKSDTKTKSPATKKKKPADTSAPFKSDLVNRFLRPEDHCKIFERKGTQIKFYMCTRCNTLFNTERKCLKHIINEHFPSDNSCTLCEMKFYANKTKLYHLAQKHGKEEMIDKHGLVLVDCRQKFECDICKKTFFSRASLLFHIGRHRVKECKHCGVGINKELEMLDHLREVHGEEIPTCGICGYKCRSRGKVQLHQRNVHMKEKTVKCDVCDMMFFSGYYMKKHMVRHNALKKYECDYCNKQFARRNTLRFHIKIHTGEKNKVCEICDERFVQKSSLNYHMMKRHPEAKY